MLPMLIVFAVVLIIVITALYDDDRVRVSVVPDDLFL
jgi:hypothetical protein